MDVCLLMVAIGCHVILGTIQISQAQVDLYITAYNSTGRPSSFREEECNKTGLVSEPIVFLNPDCIREPVLAWIGSFADYSPWVDFAGCGIINTTSYPITRNFKEEPNIFECEAACNKEFMDQYYISMSNEICYCYYQSDLTPTKCESQFSRCGENIFCNVNNATEGSTISLYRKNSSFRVLEATGECGFVEIKGGKVETTGALNCSKNASVLCSNVCNSSTTITAYPSTTISWQEAVMFCQKQDEELASIEEMSAKNSTITDGTYWISSVRDFFVQAFDDPPSNDTYCVAAVIQDDIKMYPIITDCNKSLPLACRASHGQTRTQCTTPTIRTELDHTLSSGIGLHIIIAVSGSLSLVIIILVIVCICKWPRKKKRQKMVSCPSNDAKASHVNQTYGLEDQKYQGKKKIEKLEVHQRVGNNENNTEDNIYDHSDTVHKDTHSVEGNYDSMAGIRNEMDGIYDHSRERYVGESQNLYSTNCGVESVYDSTGETNRNQVRNFTNDTLYDSC